MFISLILGLICAVFAAIIPRSIPDFWLRWNVTSSVYKRENFEKYCEGWHLYSPTADQLYLAAWCHSKDWSIKCTYLDLNQCYANQGGKLDLLANGQAFAGTYDNACQNCDLYGHTLMFCACPAAEAGGTGWFPSYTDLNWDIDNQDGRLACHDISGRECENDMYNAFINGTWDNQIRDA